MAKNERVGKTKDGWIAKNDFNGGPYFKTREMARAHARAVALTGLKQANRQPEPAKPIAAVPPPVLKNRVLFLLDSSGSMNVIQKAAVNTYNGVLEAVRAGAKATKQETLVSFYTFGETGSPVSEKYLARDIEKVEPLKYNEYRPQSGTPMLDAIGRAVRDSRYQDSDPHTSFILNVVTDGEENTSQNETPASIKALLATAQASDKWTITFLVPEGKKNALVRNYGIPEGNVQEWTATAAGAKVAEQQIAQGYTNFFGERAKGVKFTKGFFTTDLSKVTTKTVKANLTDISNQIAVLKVPAESDIQTFVEGQGIAFSKGNGFYQLTKDEKVQAGKQIMLMEKGKKTIYGGQEARDLLGLPDNQNVKVRPGNHGNWDIFIQSTSNNRKLVRGTTLLYMK
jgi:hypothetical protein